MKTSNLISPFRYPGSKKYLCKYIEFYIKENLLLGSHFFEPYAGGASVSLHLLSEGLVSHVTLIERDPLIYAFWKALKNSTEELCININKLNVNISTWYSFQKYLDANALKKYPLLEVATAGIFFNRTNFSGLLNAGPIGGYEQKSEYKISCRFNKQNLIDQIFSISEHKKQITVVYSDAISYLKRHRNRLINNCSFIYLDPPYYKNGKRLYRYYYEKKDHMLLAEYIQEQFYPWLVSYDINPYIINIFKKQKIIPITLNYTIREYKKAEEILISNLSFPPVPGTYISEQPEDLFSKCLREI